MGTQNYEVLEISSDEEDHDWGQRGDWFQGLLDDDKEASDEVMIVGEVSGSNSVLKSNDDGGGDDDECLILDGDPDKPVEVAHDTGNDSDDLMVTGEKGQDYKHTHIPAFGNWDYDQSSPITQYFESARQAGLLRYNYGEGDLYSYTGYYEQDTDLYLKPTHTVTVAVAPPRRKSKTKEAQEKSHVYYEAPHVKDQKKQRKVYDVDQTATQQRLGRNGGRAPKAVDEDLYKIPPELLCTTNPKKNRVYGFFSKCLMPSCAA